MKILNVRRALSGAIILVAIFITPEVNAVKGPLRMNAGGSLDNLKPFLDYEEIEYKQFDDEPEVYFRTTKTDVEFNQAVEKFFDLYTTGRGYGPILKRLGYPVNYKGDTVVFNNAKSKRDFENSQMNFGGQGKMAYERIKGKYKAELVPGTGTIIFANPKDKEAAFTILTG